MVGFRLQLVGLHRLLVLCVLPKSSLFCTGKSNDEMSLGLKYDPNCNLWGVQYNVVWLPHALQCFGSCVG